jgi:hypothetical protein
MASGSVVVRFPNGDSEYRLTQKVPEVGDALKANGDTWVVTEVTEDRDGSAVVTLRASASDGSVS